RAGEPSTWRRRTASEQPCCRTRRPAVNTAAPLPIEDEAEARVLEMQIKLHRWAGEDEGRRFEDLFNLVCDPTFLLVAWRRVRGNRGARTAGVDGVTVRRIEQGQGVDSFLAELRSELGARNYRPSR